MKKKKKHHEPKWPIRRVYLACGFREMRGWESIMVRKNANKWPGSWSRELRAHIFKHNLRAESNRTRSGLRFLLSKHHPQWRTSSSKIVLPKPPQTTTPTGNQVFRCPRLWETSHSNHHSYAWCETESVVDKSAAAEQSTPWYWRGKCWCLCHIHIWIYMFCGSPKLSNLSKVS